MNILIVSSVFNLFVACGLYGLAAHFLSQRQWRLAAFSFWAGTICLALGITGIVNVLIGA